MLPIPAPKPAGGLGWEGLATVIPDAVNDERRIVISGGNVERLSVAFPRTWNRPSDAEELQAQINDYERGEVLYRNAVSLGLDKDDTTVSAVAAALKTGLGKWASHENSYR